MKRITRLLALALALCLLPCFALAETYATLNQRISTRSGPGTQYVETGTFLSAGDVVKVRSKVWDAANEIWWVQVEFEYQGEKVRAYTGAWRMNVNLNNVPTEAPLDYSYLSTYADCFMGPFYSNFRPWPDTLEAGTGLTMYEVEDGFAHIECWNDQRNQLYRCWVPVSTIEVGYMYTGCDMYGWDYAGEGYSSVNGYEQYGTVNVGVLNCRTGAGTQYSTIDYLYQGDSVTIVGTGYDYNGALWYEIYLNGRYAWVYGSMVTLLNDATTSASTTTGGYSSGGYLVGETAVVAAVSANARSGPGTEYNVVATVYEYQCYTVLDTAVASNGRTWLKIRVDGRTCWISGGVATIDGQFH